MAVRQQGVPAKSAPPRRKAEEPIHTAIYNLLRWWLPARAMIHHSPNEADIANVQQRIIVIGKAKKMGMKPGWPDLEWLLDGKMFFFEVKAPGKYPSKEQRELHDELRAAGAEVAVVRSVDDAKAKLREWGLTRR